MDTTKYQLPGIPLADDKDFAKMLDIFNDIESIYHGSLVAMGSTGEASASVSCNTDVSLTKLSPISTR
jgi:hypothetical protein